VEVPARGAQFGSASPIPKENGPAKGPSFLVMVEVARIELASEGAPQSGLHA
jgi:hypothetical protein